MSPRPAPFISFAAGTLDRASLRVPLVAEAREWFALDKPAGVPCFPDPWVPRPTDLVREVRRQLREGKPQLAALGITGIERINHLDIEASGIVLCARDEAGGARLANALGSGLMELTYVLVTRGGPGREEITADQPLAPHPTEPRMVVSPGLGKKCSTRFRLRRRHRGFAVWEAVTVFDRLHQVRVHAAEVGLPILGERRYGRVDPVFLSDLKRGYRCAPGEREQPLYDHLCLHLETIVFPGPDGEPVTVRRDPPKRFAVLLERLERHAGSRMEGRGTRVE